MTPALITNATESRWAVRHGSEGFSDTANVWGKAYAEAIISKGTAGKPAPLPAGWRVL